MDERSTDGRFRSGLAARQAGVGVATLRVWEHRYGVVRPQRSAGHQRLYSSADVARLKAIKSLVDAGHPIGTVATLSDAALAVLCSVIRADGSSGPPVVVELVGAAFRSGPLATALRERGFEIAAVHDSLAAVSPGTPDTATRLWVVDLATPTPADTAALAALGGERRVLVLYRYATRDALDALRAAGHAVSRSTVDGAELAALCRRVLNLGPSAAPTVAAEREPRAEAIAPPRFGDAQLAELAAATPRVACECPRHLVDLVLSLSGFERYSANCATSTATDAALHARLALAAGRARLLIEDALEDLARAEGLLPEIWGVE